MESLKKHLKGLESKIVDTDSAYHNMYKQMEKERRTQAFTMYAAVAVIIGILIGSVFLIGVSFW